MEHRKLGTVVAAQPVNMGGILIDQALPMTGLDQLDPFLLLHHWDKPLEGNQHQNEVGVGPHPHRGFSPVTFVIQGSVHHRDSRGNDDIVHAGGVQWMNSGRGIIHSERPDKQLAKNGGPFEIIQLWINSPAAHKGDQPQYQALQAEDVPTLETEGTILNVICGETRIDNKILKGPILPTSPITIAKVVANGASEIILPIPKTYNVALYVLKGSLEIEGKVLVAKDFGVLVGDSNSIKINALENSAYLFLSGEPIGEKIETHGPFVMNSQSEIMEAMRDYQMGKMGLLIEEFS